MLRCFALVALFALVSACGASDEEGADIRDRFLSAGSFGLPMVSTDGLDWVLGDNTVPQARYWDLAVNATSVVVSGPNDGAPFGGSVYRFSAFPNGFESISAPFFRHIAYGNGVFVGIPDGGAAYRSTDGLTFVEDGRVGDLSQAGELIFADGWFIAVGRSAGPDRDVAYRSQDGRSWTQIDLGGPAGYLGDVAHHRGRFVIVGGDRRPGLGEGTSLAWVASDPTGPWTMQTIGTGEQRVAVVAVDESTIVALSGAGSVVAWRSFDGGQTWQQNGAFTATTVTDLAAGAGRFVAVTDSGQTAASTDGGATWQARSSNNGNHRSVVFVP